MERRKALEGRMIDDHPNPVCDTLDGKLEGGGGKGGLET